MGETTTVDETATVLEAVDTGLWEVPGPNGEELVVRGGDLTLEQAKLAMAHYYARLDRIQKRLKPFAEALAKVTEDIPDDEDDEDEE